MQCSEEQLAIVEAIGRGNVIVDACAGSGKTTTVLNIAARYPVPILLLTYNARLRAETSQRAADLGLENLTVHTYHSFGYHHIGKSCRTDAGIISFLAKGKSLQAAARTDAQGTDSAGSTDSTESASTNTPAEGAVVPGYSMIIVDETQDMNQYYCRLVRKIIETCPGARICVMGDRCQSIYAFNGADSRFITCADLLYGGGPWVRLSLSTSYRLTTQMADMINYCTRTEHYAPTTRAKSGEDDAGEVSTKNAIAGAAIAGEGVAIVRNIPGIGILPVRMAGSDGPGAISQTLPPVRAETEGRIRAVRGGLKPFYVHYSRPEMIVEEVKCLFRTGYAPGDVFILAPSVKSENPKNPVKRLANSLAAAGIHIYVPNSDDRAVTEDVIAGKLVFSSFHQSKGLERKVVMVVGFDDSYNKFYDTKDDANDNVQGPYPRDSSIGNAIYVAITRAKERLYLYHGRGAGYLKCVDARALAFYTTMIGAVSVRGGDIPRAGTKIAVTKLLSHVRSDVLRYCTEQITQRQVRAAGKVLRIASASAQTIGGVDYAEEVSDLNGIAIPAYYELKKYTADGLGVERQHTTGVKIANGCARTKGATDIKGIKGTKAAEAREVIDAARNISIVREIIGAVAAGGHTPGYTFAQILELACSVFDPGPVAPRLLELCNIYVGLRSGLQHRLRQIVSYNWLSDSALITGAERLRAVVDDGCEDFECAEVAEEAEVADTKGAKKAEGVEGVDVRGGFSDDLTDVAAHSGFSDDIAIEDVYMVSSAVSVVTSSTNTQVKNKPARDFRGLRPQHLVAEHIETPGDVQMEVPVVINCLGYQILGRADCVDAGRLIEVKCCTEIKPEHLLQCAIYSREVVRPRSIVYNVLTDEIIEVKASPGAVDRILRMLICTKYHQSGKISDAEFLQNMGVETKGEPELCVRCRLE